MPLRMLVRLFLAYETGRGYDYGAMWSGPRLAIGIYGDNRKRDWRELRWD